MSTETLKTEGAEDTGLLARRLAAIPGAVRKAPESAAVIAAAASPFGRTAPPPEVARALDASPLGRLVEIPAPIARTRASGPIVRHFRVLEPKMQHRADGRVTRRPTPAT